MPESTVEAKARAELAVLAARIALEWGTPEHPVFVLGGLLNPVLVEIEARDKARRVLLGALEQLIAKGAPGRHAAAIHIHQARLDDTFRTALLRAKVVTTTPAQQQALAAPQAQALQALQLLVNAPNPTPQQEAAAQALLEKIVQVPTSANAWRDKRAQYLAVLESELVDRYTRGILEARLRGTFDVPLVRGAWHGIRRVEEDVGAPKMRVSLVAVAKDFPTLEYSGSYFAKPFELEPIATQLSRGVYVFAGRYWGGHGSSKPCSWAAWRVQYGS